VLVNTSFNVRGEPIVCTPEDAYRCFVNTEMDYLVLGNSCSNARHTAPASGAHLRAGARLTHELEAQRRAEGMAQVSPW